MGLGRMIEEVVQRALSTLAKPSTVKIVTGISFFTMVASLAITPAILTRLPADYFLHERPHLITLLRQSSPPKCLMIVAKNILGTALLVVGFILLFLPGQGLLTILVGLMLLDLPRKQHFLRRIAARPHIARSLNWLRARRGKAPLIL